MKKGSSMSERGVALPLALILLVALGLIATGAVFMSNTEMRVSSSYGRSNNAIAAAEAAAEHGLVELSELSQAGQDPDSVQILAASISGFAYTVTAYSKREDPGAGGHDFNGDGDKIDVVRYDQSFGYAGASASGSPGDQGVPVKLLVATATDGETRASIQVEVAKDRASLGFDSPFTLNAPSNAKLNGNFDVDGRLYDRNGNLVSSASLNPPYGNTAQSKAAALSDCNYWKAAMKIPTEAAVDFTGSMSSGGHVAFDHTGSDKKGSTQNYDADDPLATMKFTPEEFLGVSAGVLDQYKKSASEVSDFGNLSGITYVTSGSVPSQIGGSGILIVHNPNYDVKKYDCGNFPGTCKIGYSLDPANKPLHLKLNANGTFKGIIITDQLERLNGNFTLLGALVSLGTEAGDIPANGGGAAKWSCQTVQDAGAELSGYTIRLSWAHQLGE
jgi:hypothetical protein